jgi:hypothetical protein
MVRWRRGDISDDALLHPARSGVDAAAALSDLTSIWYLTPCAPNYTMLFVTTDEGNVVLWKAHEQVAHTLRAVWPAVVPYPKKPVLRVRLPERPQAHVQLEHEEQATKHNRHGPHAPSPPHAASIQERVPGGHAGNQEDHAHCERHRISGWTRTAVGSYHVLGVPDF